MTLEASHVTVRMGSTYLLNDISLEVGAGQVVAILGPNGAGKSTLIRTLSGDILPISGEVWMNRQPLHHWRNDERARMRAMLPQDSVLKFPFAVLEVVLMGRMPHCGGLERPRDYAIARAALEAVEAAHLETRTYTTLSGGECQRVQLARVLAQIWEGAEGITRYLLLDEPTSSLDFAHQHSVLEIARRFADQGVGVLVILHDLNLAAQYADRVVILKAGQQVLAGTPGDVFTPAVIQQVFEMPVVVMPHPCFSCPLIVPALMQRQATFSEIYQ